MRDEDLDEISEEETPIEVVKEKIKSSRRNKVDSKPKETEIKNFELSFF